MVPFFQLKLLVQNRHDWQVYERKMFFETICSAKRINSKQQNVFCYLCNVLFESNCCSYLLAWCVMETPFNGS